MRPDPEPVVAAVRLRGALSPEDRAALAGFGFGLRDCDRLGDESVVGEALVTRLLESCCGASRAEMEFDATPGGKPLARLSGGGGSSAPGISVSHSSGVVVAAVCGSGRIGVDVEPVRSVPWRVVDRVFAPEDRRRLLALAPGERERAFAALWTVAEACSKAVGEGSRLLLTGLGPLGLGRGGRWRRFRWANGFLDPSTACAVAADEAPGLGRCLAAPVEVGLDWLVQRDG